MPFAELLDTLRARASRRHDTAVESAWAAAKRLAAGESVSPENVETALGEAGLTVDDFDRLVALARRRRDWFAAVDKATPARAAHDKLAAKLDGERAAFDEACRRWHERAKAADAELAALDTVVRAGANARDELCKPANLPAAVAARVQAALDEQHAANVAVGDVNRAIREQRGILDQRTWMAEQKREGGRWHPLDIDEDERLAKRAERQIAELEQEAKRAAAAVRAADDKVAASRAAALKT
jgi:hypothetical protein